MRKGYGTLLCRGGIRFLSLLQVLAQCVLHARAGGPRPVLLRRDAAGCVVYARLALHLRGLLAVVEAVAAGATVGVVFVCRLQRHVGPLQLVSQGCEVRDSLHVCGRRHEACGRG